MHADLSTFVREALVRGASRDAIRAALLDARWPADEVDAALAAWHDAGLGVPVPLRQVGLSPREAFLYLLLFASLYMVAIHVGAILFAWIERLWPDPALDLNAWTQSRDTVRFAVASVLVAFPVYLYTARLTGRALANDPGKRNSGVRRWLTYLTLFNAACVLIGDFIALLLGLLSGDLTMRFVVKAVVVAIIAGWLFTHYLGGLRRDETDAPQAASPSRWARAAGVAVVLVVMAGFWLSGSPMGARRERIDQRRLGDVQRISGAVRERFAAIGALPGSLDELPKGGPGPPPQLADPVTREPYEYRTLDSLHFEVCATFDAADSLGPQGGRADPFWTHGAGRTCFEFDARTALQRP